MIGNVTTVGYDLAALGPGIDIGLIDAKNQEATACQPELKGHLRVSMFLSVVFTEALGLLGFVTGFALGSWS